MGTLYVIATPIGNLEDITIRAIKTLFTVETIACEDTRKTGMLLQRLCESHSEFILQNTKVFDSEAQARRDPKLVEKISTSKKPQLVSYHDHNEQQKTPEIVEMIKNGRSIALVSDAGTPVIADPGYKLIQACIREDIEVVSIPGPNAAIAALCVSGLPTSSFLFLGYLPKKNQRQIELLKSIYHCFKSLKHAPTVILYESPHRLHKTLDSLLNVFGDVEIIIARELTKIHEEIWRGKISEALTHFKKTKGEFVILFGT